MKFQFHFYQKFIKETCANRHTPHIPAALQTLICRYIKHRLITNFYTTVALDSNWPVHKLMVYMLHIIFLLFCLMSHQNIWIICMKYLLPIRYKPTCTAGKSSGTLGLLRVADHLKQRAQDKYILLYYKWNQKTGFAKQGEINWKPENRVHHSVYNYTLWLHRSR